MSESTNMRMVTVPRPVVLSRKDARKLHDDLVEQFAPMRAELSDANAATLQSVVDGLAKLQVEYAFSTFLGQFVFAYKKWDTEEWAAAFDRLQPLLDLEAGETFDLEPGDLDKIKESLGETLHGRDQYGERGPGPDARPKVLRFAHCLTAAPRAKEKPKTETAAAPAS